MRAPCVVAAALAVAVLGWFAPVASAESLTRLGLQWQSATAIEVAAPYVYAQSPAEQAAWQGLCATPTNCSNATGTRWVEQDPDAAGRPHTISFVDDVVNPGLGREFRFYVQHAVGSPSVSDVVGTATITHGGGETYSVPFRVSAGGPRAYLGISNRPPTPPPAPTPPGAGCRAYFVKPGARVRADQSEGLLSTAAGPKGASLRVAVVDTTFDASRLQVDPATGAFMLDAPRRRTLGRITFRVTSDQGLSSADAVFYIGVGRDPRKSCPPAAPGFLGEHHWWGRFDGAPSRTIDPALRVSRRAKRWQLTSQFAGACRGSQGPLAKGTFRFRARLKGAVGFQTHHDQTRRALLSPTGVVRGRAPNGRPFVARFRTFRAFVGTRINKTGAIRSRWSVSLMWTVKCNGAPVFRGGDQAYVYSQE